KQVLMNFGSNAIKYGRPRGTVRLRATQHGTSVRVSVEDDGFGIPLDKQAVLFQPFQRAGQETGPIEGTGIGLVISKRLAELMRGSVGFQSAEGQGSTFWLDLPQPTAAAPRAMASGAIHAANALSGPEGTRYLILYVEDNPSNIAFMRDLLSEFARVDLLTAPTAEIGIELARARRPDLIILDINLPGMSGIEASSLLRRWPETRDVPIIALSAATMLLESKRLEQAGFDRYLTKPVKVDELAATLEDLLIARSDP
ncbi:MAG TPA: ATP-binding protein, partial [Polyangiaceae bacterium]|nr:ATP-binding protein [Polyangiaceae bacterium]